MVATEIVSANVDTNLIDSKSTIYNVVSNIYAKNESNVKYLILQIKKQKGVSNYKFIMWKSQQIIKHSLLANHYKIN